MCSRSIYTPFIAVALILFATITHAGFQDVLNTPAAKSALADKSFLSGIALAGKRLVCVGWRGHIIYSDDRGKNWEQASVPVSSDLVAVHFPSPQKGWAVGHDGVVLHSTDAGITWKKQLDGRAAVQVMVSYYNNHPPVGLPGGARAAQQLSDVITRYGIEGADKPFLDVWFENETTGFIVGAFNLIFHTADGGKSWEPWFDRTDNPQLLHLDAIRPAGKDLFIVGEQGLILKLDRQAGRFSAMDTPYNGSFFGITAKSAAVIVFGLRGNAFRSQDGGGKWRKVETGVPVGLTGATVTEDGRIVLVSQGGHVIMSTDEGASFTGFKLEMSFPMNAVLSLDKSTLVFAGPNGVQVVPIK
jgi:photosystem II stability/assembly factor-like uncharacterized protein